MKSEVFLSLIGPGASLGLVKKKPRLLFSLTFEVNSEVTF